MARKPINPPTDEEILAYANVPYQLAAKYLGWSDVSVRYALQQERAPFGVAAQNPKTGSWAYNISPGLLVRYKRGELPYYRLKEMIAIATDGIEQILDMRLAGAQSVFDAITAASLPQEPPKRRKRNAEPA